MSTDLSPAIPYDDRRYRAWQAWQAGTPNPFFAAWSVGNWLRERAQGISQTVTAWELDATLDAEKRERNKANFAAGWIRGWLHDARLVLEPAWRQVHYTEAPHLLTRNAYPSDFERATAMLHRFAALAAELQERARWFETQPKGFTAREDLPRPGALRATGLKESEPRARRSRASPADVAASVEQAITKLGKERGAFEFSAFDVCIILGWPETRASTVKGQPAWKALMNLRRAAARGPDNRGRRATVRSARAAAP